MELRRGAVLAVQLALLVPLLVLADEEEISIVDVEEEAAPATPSAAATPAARPAAQAGSRKSKPGGGGVDLSAIAAFVALIAAIIIPLVILLRTQKEGEKREDAAQKAETDKELAKELKKQAKLERGTGKKKKGALARMHAGKKAADGDDDDDDDEPASHAQAKKAERQAANDEAARERDAERQAAKEPREGETAKEAAKRVKEEEREARQKAREEAARLAKEEEERKKQEEYDHWKEMFSVEDEGADAAAAEEDEGLLGRFVSYIKAQKVAVLDDLAGEFNLKVQDVISRVQGLEQMGYISGVVDDRGKFIYISTTEMGAVAKFVQKKGRVRIATLAQESNKLIDLEPRAVDVEDEADEGEGAQDAATGGGER